MDINQEVIQLETWLWNWIVETSSVTTRRSPNQWTTYGPRSTTVRTSSLTPSWWKWLLLPPRFLRDFQPLRQRSSWLCSSNHSVGRRTWTRRSPPSRQAQGMFRDQRYKVSFSLSLRTSRLELSSVPTTQSPVNPRILSWRLSIKLASKPPWRVCLAVAPTPVPGRAGFWGLSERACSENGISPAVILSSQRRWPLGRSRSCSWCQNSRVCGIVG